MDRRLLPFAALFALALHPVVAPPPSPRYRPDLVIASHSPSSASLLNPSLIQHHHPFAIDLDNDDSVQHDLE